MKMAWEVFWRFLFLGCVSFGGPAAHIGYFQKTFVQQLKWLDAAAYARLVALSQFLPGLGSSQVGFAVGFQRAGLAGAVAAFVGFTLPSFVLMYGLAVFSAAIQDASVFVGIVNGLKILAVVVVADAVLTMSKSFCRRRITQVLALTTAFALLVLPGVITQLTMLVLAAAIGACFKINKHHQQVGKGSVAWTPIICFVFLLLGLPLLGNVVEVGAASLWLELVAVFYQTGSLVFGGGHVVLPLLQQNVGEQLSPDRFLLGYAAAQAMPGPMFSFATFLGAELAVGAGWPRQLISALMATLAVFLPGFLLILGLQGAFQHLAAKPKVASAIGGVNASVVGLLAAALYQPVFISAVTSAVDVVLVGFVLLRLVKLPVLVLVCAYLLLGALFL